MTEKKNEKVKIKDKNKNKNTRLTAPLIVSKLQFLDSRNVTVSKN